MKTRNLQIVRTLLDVTVIVTLPDKSSYQMYGQIANGTLEEDSIIPALAEGKALSELPPEVRKDIFEAALTEFKKYC